MWLVIDVLNAPDEVNQSYQLTYNFCSLRLQ